MITRPGSSGGRAIPPAWKTPKPRPETGPHAIPGGQRVRVNPPSAATGSCGGASTTACPAGRSGSGRRLPPRPGTGARPWSARPEARTARPRTPGRTWSGGSCADGHVGKAAVRHLASRERERPELYRQPLAAGTTPVAHAPGSPLPARRGQRQTQPDRRARHGPPAGHPNARRANDMRRPVTTPVPGGRAPGCLIRSRTAGSLKRIMRPPRQRPGPPGVVRSARHSLRT